MTELTVELALLVTMGLLLIVLLSVWFARAPTSALPLVLLVELTASGSSSLGVPLGQLHVYPGDILAVALAAATVMRWQHQAVDCLPPGVDTTGRQRPSRHLVILFALLLLSMLRGAAAFGLQPSVVAGRELLAMLTAAVFFSTVRITPKLIRAVRNWLLVASAIILVVAANFWLQRGFGTYAATGDRALNGLQALIILETTIITALFPPLRGSVVRCVVPLTGLVVVVLSSQRTVWAAGLVAATVLVTARQKSRGATPAAVPRLIVIPAVLCVVLLVVAGPPGATSDLRAGYQQTSISQDSTFSWRLKGWSALIERQVTGPSADLVVGSPSGTGDDRVVDGRIVSVAAHSMYVSTLTITGVIGLALLLWAYIAALRKSRERMRSASAFSSRVALLFTALLALQLIYFIGYSSGALVGLILGLGCGFVYRIDQDESVDRRRYGTVGAPVGTQRAPAARVESPS